jgi:hypothetical protein
MKDNVRWRRMTFVGLPISLITAVVVAATMRWLSHAPKSMTPPPNPLQPREENQYTMQLQKVPVMKRDPLQSFAPKSFRGKLVYATKQPVQGSPEWKSFLILRQADKASQTDTVSAYRAATDFSNNVFDPQFSPDGRFVLLRTGPMGDRWDRHRLFIWDLSGNRVQPGPADEVTYYSTPWSPDSNFFAYIVGGDVEGHVGSNEGSLQLYTYDIKASRSSLIAQNPAVLAVAWSQANKLLYSAFPANDGKPADKVVAGQVDSKVRPDIFETPANGDAPKLILKDGYRPLPSPDNTWIACFTSTDPAKPQSPSTEFFLDVPRQAYLCLYNRAEGRRMIIRPETRTYSHLLWTRDSKSLIAMKTIQESPHARTEITLIDVLTSRIRQLARLRADDIEPVTRVETQPQFEPIGVSQSNPSFAFVRISEMVGRNEIGHYVQRTSIKAINTETGAVSTVAQINTSLGVDWHDESTLSVNQ